MSSMIKHHGHPPIWHTVEERPEGGVAAAVVVKLEVLLRQPHRDHLLHHQIGHGNYDKGLSIYYVIRDGGAGVFPIYYNIT